MPARCQRWGGGTEWGRGGQLAGPWVPVHPTSGGGWHSPASAAYGERGGVEFWGGGGGGGYIQCFCLEGVPAVGGGGGGARL